MERPFKYPLFDYWFKTIFDIVISQLHIYELLFTNMTSSDKICNKKNTFFLFAIVRHLWCKFMDKYTRRQKIKTHFYYLFQKHFCCYFIKLEVQIDTYWMIAIVMCVWIIYLHIFIAKYIYTSKYCE